ncbi:DUF397 domain-containing protein [Streptomyces erythrochromogenes]|uniref:DUF397 domain-containing protein n=1 Tax=Streptomyces erythrochromogenes TaxID=285574 RepID=UPI00382290BC
MSTPLKWFKSSHSSDQGGACLEAAYAWRKSSYSTDEGDACVEVSPCSCADTVHVRDSKVTDGPVLTLAPGAWDGLTGWVRS